MNTIVNYLNTTFGPSNIELVLQKRKQTNKKIKNLIDTMEILRFWLFPITLTLYIIGLILALAVVILNFIIDLIEIAFEYVNSSFWLKVTWFGMKKDEFEAIVNEEKSKLEK